MNTDNTSLVFRLVGVVFAFAGICLLIGSGFMYRSTVQFLDDVVSATGTVVSNYRSTNSKGEATYYPEVQFVTAHGEQIEFRSGSGSRSDHYLVGTEVPVLYTPSDPQSAEINSWSAQWFGPTALLILGVGFTGVGTTVTVTFWNEPTP